jgi:hypothetical protein
MHDPDTVQSTSWHCMIKFLVLNVFRVCICRLTLCNLIPCSVPHVECGASLPSGFFMFQSMGSMKTKRQEQGEINAFMQGLPCCWVATSRLPPCMTGYSPHYKDPTSLEVKNPHLSGASSGIGMIMAPTDASLGALHPPLWFCYILRVPSWLVFFVKISLDYSNLSAWSVSSWWLHSATTLDVSAFIGPISQMRKLRYSIPSVGITELCHYVCLSQRFW